MISLSESRRIQVLQDTVNLVRAQYAEQGAPNSSMSLCTWPVL
jgi:hypothetical protein